MTTSPTPSDNPPLHHRSVRKLTHLATAFACSAFAWSSLSYAQTAPAPAASTKPADAEKTVVLENFVVEGYRASLEQSLDTKRKSNAIVDVITAEDVGKFPDTNVAESLSHLPGVTVDRLYGQGERVSILGTDPNLNRTLLNGQTVASGDWFILDAPSRQFNYTLLAPEVIGQAEVYKTSEAWLPEGSVGGTILLHTRSPLSGKPFAFSGSAYDMYNDRSKDHDFNFNQVVGWHNDQGTFGIILGLQYSQEMIRRDGVEALGTVTAGAASPNTGIDPPAPPSSLNVTQPNAVLPNAINAALFLQKRKRTGGNAVVEWKPTDRLHIEVNALDVTVDNNNFNTSYYVFPGWWRGAVVASGTVVNGIVDSGTINQNIGVMDLFYREATIKTEAYDFKATYTGEGFTISEQAGFTEATGGTQAQYYIEPLLSTPGADVGSTSYTFTGGKSAPGFTFAKAGVNTNPSAWTVGGPWWNGNIASDPETDQEKYAQIDGTIDITSGPFKKVRTGFRYTEHETGQNWYNISLTTLPFYTLNNFGPYQTPGNYLSGLDGVTNDMTNHVMIDPGLLKNAVFGAPYRDANGNITTMTMQQALAAGNGFQPTQSFQVEETTKAVYVQGDFAFSKATGNVGLRYVQTDTTSSGYTASGTVVTPNSVDKSYDNFLPSFNLVYPLTADSQLRFGASQVIARPNYADMSSSVTLYDSIRTGVGGNPNLEPYESTNFDAAYEWYFAKNSAAAVNVFYKDIDSYILKSNGVENHFNQNQGTVTPYLISRPENAGSAKSKGVALFYQHTFPFNLGLTANYTFVDAEGDKGQELPFASEHQVNISPYYESGRFLARLTYAWRSEYFTNVDRGNNVYTDDYTQLDVNFAYNITKNFSLTLAGMNLTDETYYVFTKLPNGAEMFQAHYKNGRRFQAGIHWNF